jgi:hypothetical protein
VKQLQIMTQWLWIITVCLQGFRETFSFHRLA